MTETYVAQIITLTPLYFIPIADRFYPTTANIFQVGIMSVNSKKNWFLGAHVGLELFASPSSTSEFPQWVEVASFKCQLRKLTLIETPKYENIPRRLSVRFPNWLRDVYLEIWAYDETSLQDDSYSQQMRNIQTSIDNL